MVKKLSTLLLLATAAAALAAPGAFAGSAPKVTLLGAVLQGDQIAVTVDVKGFKLLPKKIGAKRNAAGGGHYHILVKGPGTDGKFVYAGASGATTGTTGGALAPDFSADPDGRYLVRIELANNDHSSLASKRVLSNVVKAASVTLESATVVTDSAGKKQVQVAVDIDRFGQFPDKIGNKKNTPGGGHFHIYVDGEYAGAGAGTTGTSGGAFAPDFSLTPGKHTVSVHLGLNNHAEVGANAASNELEITV